MSFRLEAAGGYLALASNLQGFSSNLPIVIVDTQAQHIVYGTYKRAAAVFIDSGADGRARITDPADFAGRSGIKTRGRSTAGAPKHSYGFETWGPDDLDKDVSLLGLPAESDWVLYAPYSFDRALINNAFMFELSNRVGRYAVRTRFVELYLNTNGGKVSSSNYTGLYIFMEKIKRGPERVDVEDLDPWDRAEPQIDGGYMLKIDRPDSGDRGFRTARGNPTYGDGTLCYVDPKETDITAAQSAWIRGYLDEPIVLDRTTVVKTRVLTPENPYSPWSGLSQAYFAVDVLPAYLRVTELMYNPAAAGPALGEPDVDTDRFEFIELTAERCARNRFSGWRGRHLALSAWRWSVSLLLIPAPSIQHPAPSTYSAFS